MQVYRCAFASSQLAWTSRLSCEEALLISHLLPDSRSLFLSCSFHNGFFSLGSLCLRFSKYFVFSFCSVVYYIRVRLLRSSRLRPDVVVRLGKNILHVSSSRNGSWESFFLLNCVIFHGSLQVTVFQKPKKTTDV